MANDEVDRLKTGLAVSQYYARLVLNALAERGLRIEFVDSGIIREVHPENWAALPCAARIVEVGDGER